MFVCLFVCLFVCFLIVSCTVTFLENGDTNRKEKKLSESGDGDEKRDKTKEEMEKELVDKEKQTAPRSAKETEQVSPKPKGPKVFSVMKHLGETRVHRCLICSVLQLQSCKHCPINNGATLVFIVSGTTAIRNNTINDDDNNNNNNNNQQQQAATVLTVAYILSPLSEQSWEQRLMGT